MYKYNSIILIARIGSPESGFEKGRNTNLFLEYKNK